MKTLRLTGAPDVPEREVQAALIRCLCARGWLVVRINSGCHKTATGAFFRSYLVAGMPSDGKTARGGLGASSGFADVLALKGDTRSEPGTGGNVRARLFEVKAKGGKPSESQKRFFDFAQARGVPVEIIEGMEALETLDLA
jgi:hypothetical protein